MTKKAKKLFLRSVAALAALTVVSCGLLGSTFARYISTSEGDAVTGIAKWDVDLDNKFPNTTAIMAVENKLSPDVNGTFNGTTDRVQSTGGALALTITNLGDVDANITVSLGGSELIYYEEYSDDAQTAYDSWGSGFAVAEDGTITAPSKAEANAVIKMEFAYSTTSAEVSDATDWKSLADIADEINDQNNSTGIKLSAKSGDADGGSFYFFVRATWTSQDKYFYDKDQGTAEKMSNLLDTWFGEKIVAVGQRITFTALQSSELPNP